MRTLCALTEVSLNSYKLWDPILRRGLSANLHTATSAVLLWLSSWGQVGNAVTSTALCFCCFFLSKIKLCSNMYLICISSAFNALSNYSVSLLLAEYNCVIKIIFWLSNKHISILNNKSFIVTPIKAACEMWSGNKLQLVWAKHNIFFLNWGTGHSGTHWKKIFHVLPIWVWQRIFAAFTFTLYHTWTVLWILEFHPLCMKSIKKQWNC